MADKQSKPRQRNLALADERKFYRLNHSMMKKSLRKFRLSIQDEEDLIQESFSRFFAHQEQFEFALASAYLQRIVYNLAIDLYRFKKHRTHEFDLDSIENIASLSQEDEQHKKVKHFAFARFVHRIKHKPGAEILIKFYDQEESLKTIAAQSQECIGSVSSRLSRMRKKYRHEFEQSYKEAEKLLCYA